MTEQLKPVRCGCGGEAEVKKHTFYRALPLYSVKCDKCGIQVPSRNTEAEAITAWNRAMGERSAKVKKGAYDLMRCECGMPVSSNYDYCPKCRARLEWGK